IIIDSYLIRYRHVDEHPLLKNTQGGDCRLGPGQDAEHPGCVWRDWSRRDREIIGLLYVLTLADLVGVVQIVTNILVGDIETCTQGRIGFPIKMQPKTAGD